MKVQRDGDEFEVESLGDDWRFWEDRFTTDWEPGTKATIERFVHGGTYVDVGAWVGPTVLWGSRVAQRVIAVEPDPVAYRHLRRNVTANNCQNVSTIRCAVGKPGAGYIYTDTGFGDSLTSTLAGAHRQAVAVRSLQQLIGNRTDVQLIKIDVEGAEGEIIPAEIDYLRELAAPLLVALHPHMWQHDPRPALEDWTCEAVTMLDKVFLP